MKKYILTIDQGTTATKVVLHSINGNIEAISTNPIRQIYLQDGWVEHCPYDILSSIKKGIRDVIAEADILSKQILAIGIGNQGETIIPFDRYTGEPLYNAIVWQDRRTSLFCKHLKEKIDEKIFR